MSSLKYLLLLPGLLFLLSCSNNQAQTNEASATSDAPKITEPRAEASVENIKDIPLPAGFMRAVPQDSFGAYLRDLPLKPAGTQVRKFDGSIKAGRGIYDYVIDLKIGDKDLHQCADAVMRLRAEYLWRSGQYDKIHFNFTNGFRVNYSEWMKGRRVVINGNKTYWNDRSAPSNTYADFWKYLELIFAYAGTASLEKELVAKSINEATIGDVLIKGGFPGHAVIIVDQAEDAQTGEPIYLLAQSYMPAQEIQVLVNPSDPNLSPWYQLQAGQITTPEWDFSSQQLKVFQNE